MKDWKEIVKSDSRYKDFVIMDEPAVFSKLFADQDIPCVQLHSIQVYENSNEEDIVGFCGSFRWENNEIIPLDGDSYAKETTVYGYSWFINGNAKCLDILVGEDW